MHIDKVSNSPKKLINESFMNKHIMQAEKRSITEKQRLITGHNVIVVGYRVTFTVFYLSGCIHPVRLNETLTFLQRYRKWHCQ